MNASALWGICHAQWTCVGMCTSHGGWAENAEWQSGPRLLNNILESQVFPQHPGWRSNHSKGGGGWWLSEALSIKPLKTISQTIYILISTEIQATNLANLKKEFLCQHYYILVFNLVLKRGSSGVPLHGYPFQLLDSTSRQVTHSYRASVTSSVKWNHASYLHCGFVEQIRWDSVHIALSSVPGTFHGLRELEFLPVVSVGEALVSCYERFKSPSISFIKSLTIFQGEWETKGI